MTGGTRNHSIGFAIAAHSRFISRMVPLTGACARPEFGILRNDTLALPAPIHAVIFETVQPENLRADDALILFPVENQMRLRFRAFACNDLRKRNERAPLFVNEVPRRVGQLCGEQIFFETARDITPSLSDLPIGSSPPVVQIHSAVRESRMR